MENNRNGTIKVVGIVVAVLVGIAGLCFAMIEPMAQRISFIESNSANHLLLHAHPGAIHDLATINEKFTEIETQFRELRILRQSQLIIINTEIEHLRKWKEAHNFNDGQRTVQIKMLENTVYQVN